MCKKNENARRGKLDDIDGILSQLTLEEKISLLSGSSFVSATGVPRLNIPALIAVDSVNGVKGTSYINGTTTACFPSTTCLGSTWNPSLIHQLGREIAVQAKCKSASVILGPTVNIQRDPRGGRNFECFSEDPLLTGRLAAALINGIQEGGVAACPKHFVGNDSETKRRFYHVKNSIDERPMREIYLAAFQYLLKDSAPLAIMTAYNKIEGLYCSESPIIRKVLRGEWDYNVCIMSDWYGTRSGLPSLKAGLDLEMPGPSVFRGKKLVEDVKKGMICDKLIDERVRNVLRLISKTSKSHRTGPERSVICQDTNLLARQIASEGIVLLKNDCNVLPLRLTDGKQKIAVIGAAALNPPIGGGGSATAPLQYMQSPYECIRSAHPSPELVQHSPGVKVHVTTPSLPLSQTRAKNGNQGIDVEFFVRGQKGAVLEEYEESAQIVMIGRLKPPLIQDTFSHYIVSTVIIPTTTGLHTLAIQATAPFRLSLNKDLVLSDKMQPPPSVEDFLFVPSALERSVQIPMIAGQEYQISAVVQPYVPKEETGEPRVHATKLCFIEEYSEKQMREEAVQLAQDSDLSIIYAGRNAEMESEGFDLTSIRLPSNQEALIKEVALASKKTILVLYGGNPIDVSEYVHTVDALLCAHFPGQEGGQAIADILTGKTCPSGKLAVSWPEKLEHVPSFAHFPATENADGEWEIEYKEGLGVGYRSESYIPRYPFGYGLSYTTFQCKNLRVGVSSTAVSHPKDKELVIEIDVTNTGSIAGHEVVQVFVHDVESSVWRPREELKAFEKVYLEPGQRKTVQMRASMGIAFGFWDDRVKGAECWRAEAGEYKLRIGGLYEHFTLLEGFCWRGL